MVAQQAVLIKYSKYYGPNVRFRSQAHSIWRSQARFKVSFWLHSSAKRRILAGQQADLSAKASHLMIWC